MIGPTAPLQEVRYPVLATQVDALEVHVLHPLPRVEVGIQDGGVVGRRDPGVVEEHVYAPETLRHLSVHLLYVFGVRDVGVDVEAADLIGGLVARFVGEVGYADAGVLLGEAPGCLAAYAARAAGHDGDFSFEASRHA